MFLGRFRELGACGKINIVYSTRLRRRRGGLFYCKRWIRSKTPILNGGSVPGLGLGLCLGLGLGLVSPNLKVSKVRVS